MNRNQRPFASLLVITVAALAAHVRAHAQAPLTRAQVVAQYEEAARTGDILAPGDSGLKLNELYPDRYPRPAPAPALTRAQVVAELTAATRSGDVLASGDSGLKLNELYPQRYPAPTITAMGKTRDQVRAETLEAIRTGDILAAGDSGLKMNEVYPQRYLAPIKARVGQVPFATGPDLTASESLALPHEPRVEVVVGEARAYAACSNT
jgi:Domain of unknown function (DUF4148)